MLISGCLFAAANGHYPSSQLQKTPEHESSYALLELFAHGTYQEYKGMSYSYLMRATTDRKPVYHIAKSSSYPPLSPQQVTKLKYLSLASLATQNRVSLHVFCYSISDSHPEQILPYSTLLAELEISTIRELEDLIIDAIYQDIVRGKLDQKEQQFEVEFTMGRDLQVSQLPALLDELKNW